MRAKERKQKSAKERKRAQKGRKSASPIPHPSKPRPCNMPQAKTEVALQFSDCCAAETALQHWLFCSAEVIWTKSCAAANEKLHCNIEKAALQESGVFLPLSCGFQAPTFRHPRFGPPDQKSAKERFRLKIADNQACNNQVWKLTINRFFWALVATIYFSPFTHRFCRFPRRSFTGFFSRNKNAEFTESLLPSLFVV